MNGNKALNYLIVMFVVLNILLGFGNYNKFVGQYTISDSRIESILSLLK